MFTSRNYLFFPKTVMVVFTEEDGLKFIETMKIKIKDC